MDGSGLARPHDPHLQVPFSKLTLPPQRGQPVASPFQVRPAPAHKVLGAAMAAHATRGSSALATTAAPGPASSQVRRQRSATWRTSLLRSSWSRDRFNRTRAAGRTSLATLASHASSTSSTAGERGRALASATAKPVGRLAPATLVTTSLPVTALRALAKSLVVVVLPFVPETRATLRPDEK